jgi:hypothetical protein
MDNDGYISNGELFQVLKMMVGNNLKDTQLQQIVDKTILFADKDEDGRISFEEFCSVSNLFKSFFLLNIYYVYAHLHINIYKICIYHFRLLVIQIFIRKW